MFSQDLKTCIQMQDMQILQNVLRTMNPQVTQMYYSLTRSRVKRTYSIRSNVTHSAGIRHNSFACLCFIILLNLP